MMAGDFIGHHLCYDTGISSASRIFILANSHSPYFIRAIEVKMAENECALQGRYYFMKQDENAYISTDVTENTNEIYDALYQPLNLL